MSLATTSYSSAAASKTSLSSVGTTSQWSALVKGALSPRLVRLPILCLVFLHFALCILHIPSSLESVVKIALLPFRPTLLLCSLLAFLTGILPHLVIRRRILARTTWQAALCATISTVPQSVGLPFRLRVSSDTTLGRLLLPLSLPSTWLSAALDGLTSLLSNAFLLASFAAYSHDPTWWLPYQRVPSIRKTTGSFGRTITTSTYYWRPNEVVWVLLLQPFLLGIAAALLAAVDCQGRWAIPPLRVPRFPTSLIDALPSLILSAPVTTSSTLSKRVSSTLPPLMLRGGSHYLVLSTALLLIYIPFRLPLFRTLLVLLPPNLTLRRLVIPSLKSGYDLTTASHLLTLFLASSACAFLQGATRALAAHLWEIYATHPLAITASHISSPMARGESGEPLETMVAALEQYAPQNLSTVAVGPPAIERKESEAERSYLFTHALFDFAALCTDTTSQGAQVRRSFFKHFAVPTVPSAASGGATVSAWERVSEVLLKVMESAVDSWERGAGSSASTDRQGDQEGASSTVAIAARSKGKELEVVRDGMISNTSPSTTGARSAAAATRPAQAQTSAVAPAGTSSSQTATVWQRLIASAPAPGAPPSPSTSNRQVAAQPTSAAAPVSASPSGTSSHLVSVLASTLQELVARGESLLPHRVAQYLPSSLAVGSSALALSSASTSTPSAELLHLLLIVHAAYTLLLLSLQEDEWGSVTLSERRQLGVEKWVSVGGRVEKSVLGKVGTGEQEDQRQYQTKQGSARNDPRWEWRLLLAELQRGRAAVLREFSLTQ